MPSVPSYMQPGAKFPGALQVIREQLPRFFEEPHTEAMRNVADVLIPQTPSDILLEAAFSPIGKAKRLASLAGAAATYSPESEAGVGGLRSLLKMLIGDTPKRLNEDALRVGDPDYTPIETWESFLTEKNMVPKGLHLSSYVNPRMIQEPSPRRALRAQRGSDLNLGISATPGWMGTHFDMSGGPQALDILAHAKRKPTLLDDPHLVEASIDPQARMLVVNDEIVNDPGHIYWAKLLGQDKIFNDERVLQEALKKKGIQGLLYNNTYEGNIKKKNWPRGRFYEDKPVDLDGLLWQFGNPGISVLDPNIMNIDSISRKKGGLAQCSCGGAK